MNLVERFKTERIAINCETEQEANKFIDWCYDNGLEFKNSKKTYFSEYLERTCYSYNYCGDCKLEYGRTVFYDEKNWKIIKYKEFMNKPITNLEYILNNFDRETILNTDSICMKLRTCLGMPDCVDDDIKRIKIHCCECKFNDQYEVLKCLNEIYKEPITKLTKVQQEILKCLPQCSSIQILNNEIIIHKDNLEFFLSKLGVKIIECDCGEKSIKIKDILENCEVVENVD